MEELRITISSHNISDYILGWRFLKAYIIFTAILPKVIFRKVAMGLIHHMKTTPILSHYIAQCI